VRVEELLERRAATDAAKAAVVCGGVRYSYSDVADGAGRMARMLLDGGLRPGARVGIRLENSIEAVMAIFAVLKARGAFFVINPQGSAGDQQRLLVDSGASALVCRRADGAVHVAWQSPGNDGPADDELAALVYTSGSTGEPKGVMLTHRNLLAATGSIASYLENRADDVILSVLPLAFTYGLTQVLTSFHAGATLVLERSFTYPAAVLDTLEREAVTGLAMVPTMATLLLQHLKDRRLPHLRYVTNAAAALSAAKVREIRQRLPHVAIYSMYGQTESMRVSYLPPELIDAHPDSVGRAIPGTEAFVVDEQGRRLPPGVIGELVVRGPHVMKGYWNKPAETDRALKPSPEGGTVLHTGDLFRADEAGLLYFVERKDGMIKTRGEKVAPRYVEEVIAGLAGVAEVAVYGVPDELLGEAIAAVVVPDGGVTVTPDLVRRHCLEHLAPWMVPKTVSVRASVPMTATGKISRRLLRSMASPC
jgi:acyl-CoA synthetase (AMP-forming)/AMP-acid ligase II